MAAGAEQLHKRWQSEIDKMKAIQKDLQRHASTRQQLEAQIRENKAVREELTPLVNESDSKVFKLIGPALIPQSATDAKQTVDKRLQYIEGEAKRTDNLINECEKKQTSQREVLAKLQQQLQQAQVKAAIK